MLAYDKEGWGMAETRAGGPVIALVGNPNVGKSTVFNALTGLKQHTGNWPGKTVSTARGEYTYHGRRYTLVDLPGTYSLTPGSADEEVTRDYLLSGQADVTLVVADATCLARNLALVLQVLETCWPVVVCVNLLDEAAKKHIQVDLTALQDRLGCPVVGASARDGYGLAALRGVLEEAVLHPLPRPTPVLCTGCACGCEDCRTAAFVARAAAIAEEAVTMDQARAQRRDRLLDRLLTSRATGIPVMLALLAGILWLTMAGANVPSELLSSLLFSWQEPLRGLLQNLGAPWWLEGAVVDGIYRTVAWVVSVMLPPMAIFFPLFTLLEDLGYLPRVAFVLDHAFQKARACGKQALTMCMSLGCTACGVTGCRIIDSPRERLAAMLTSSLVPCNGKFPTLLALITLFLVGQGGSLVGAAALLGVLLLGVAATLGCTRLLTATVLKGTPSAFALELPPFRRPRVGQVVVRSLLDRTVFVLARAVAVAAPAGGVIWLLANITLGDATILAHITGFLDPVGQLMGLDGVILTAFLLGWPANEIVMPVMLMAYLAQGSLVDMDQLTGVGALLEAQGWTMTTAVCTLLFTLFHWPCSTTCLTIWRESKSIKWTLVAVAVPTLLGVGLCIAVNALGSLLGI